MIHAKTVLSSVKDIDFVYFDSQDVVRHPVVASIIEAYDAEKQEALTDQKKMQNNK